MIEIKVLLQIVLKSCGFSVIGSYVLLYYEGDFFLNFVEICLLMSS